MKIQHSPGIVAIVVYKSLAALLLAATAIGLFFISFRQEMLVDFAETYIAEGKLQFLEWFINQAINLKPKTLELTSLAMSLYAIVTAIEAVGLWFEKAWAELLVIGLVGLSIPLEIFELAKEFTLIKLAIFLINAVILLYLIYYFRKTRMIKGEFER